MDWTSDSEKATKLNLTGGKNRSEATSRDVCPDGPDSDENEKSEHDGDENTDGKHALEASKSRKPKKGANKAVKAAYAEKLMKRLTFFLFL